MRYVNIKQPGDLSVLSIESTVAPTPRANELLLEVACAGINRPDVLQRQGKYPVPEGASPIMGLEVSGRVLEVGDQVAGFAVGDRVCALCNGGGYAERVCVPAGQCLPVPKGLTMAEAAALPETAFTVWHNVFQRGRLQAGETLLIHAGASGIGTMAIMMAKALDSTVMVTASSASKCQACLDLGADVAIDYNLQDFVERVLQITDGAGVDVILDMVGGDYVSRNIKSAAMEGRIVSIAFLRGSRVALNLAPVMLRRLTLTGSTLRPQSEACKAEIARQLRARIWPLIEQGSIRPLLARQYPMEEVAAAHEFLESNRVIGKLVLEIGAG